jgi:hypothetical protein
MQRITYTLVAGHLWLCLAGCTPYQYGTGSVNTGRTIGYTTTPEEYAAATAGSTLPAQRTPPALPPADAATAYGTATLEIPSPPVPMGSITYLDARGGFRDVAFGRPLSAYPEMRLIKNDGDLKMYCRDRDALSLGAATLTSIRYGFYKGHLLEVWLFTKEHLNSQAALAALQEAYGKGRKPNQFLEIYMWSGTRVHLTYQEQVFGESAGILFNSVALQAQLDADQKATAKKAAAGL